MSDDDYSDNRETAGHVTPGSSVEGKITADGDIDWIKVSLTAGQRYIIGLSGKDSGDGTLEDPYLRGIYDSSGNLIDGTSDDNSGWYRDADVEFVPETTGEYYIAVGSHGDSGDLWSFTGTYALSVDAEIDDDYSDNRETTGNITPGASVKGEIGSGSDIDWFRVELTKGKTYVIELKGRDTVDGTLGNPYLRGIYDSGGNYIDDTSNIYSTKEDDNYNRHWSYNARVVFTPETTGTYYIAADSDGGDTWQKRGTYTLSIADDDYADNRATASHITPGSSVEGKITADGDIDWIKVSLTAGQRYIIGLSGKDSGDGTLEDPYLRGIYDSSGNLIDGTSDDNSGWYRDADVEFVPETTGEYYIAVGSHGDSGDLWSFTGTYALSVDAEIDDDYSDNRETTGNITPGASVKGEIGSGSDIDWFRVELTKGKTYVIELKGRDTVDGTLGNPYLRGIYDSGGNYIDDTSNIYSTKEDDNYNRHWSYNARVVFTPETTGTYYIAADSDGGDTWQKRGTYTLSIADDDYADNRATASHITPGSSVEGKITADGDIDWIKVSLTAGQRYIIGLSGKDSGDGTLEDPYLRGIYDSSGNLIDGTSDDNSGWYRDADVEFVPETTGEYYIAVGSHGDSGDLWSFTGTYALSVDAEIDDDYSDNRETTGNITPGASVKGEIGSGSDIDWFRVELAKGKNYVIELKGRDTVEGTLGDPYLRGIYDSNGNFIDGTSNFNSTKEDDNYNRHWSYNARVIFTPETTGTYYIAADSEGGNTWQKRGTYTLSITDDDYADIKETAGHIIPGSTAKGEITSSSDVDWFWVHMIAGQRYIINLRGKDSGSVSLEDPYLRGVYDSSGNLIDGTADDNSGLENNAYVDFTPETTGDYYIAAGSHGNTGDLWSFTGTYELSIEENDDYPSNKETSGSVDPGGSVTGEITSKNDSDWFRVTLKESKNYIINLKGSDTGDGTLGDPYVQGIYDSDGHYISGSTNDDSGTEHNARVVFKPSHTGEYYISADSYGESTGTYTLSVEDIDDYGASIETAAHVTAGNAYRGEIEVAGDQDWFRFKLYKGIAYEIFIRGTKNGEGTLENPDVQGIYDSSGNYIDGTTDDDGSDEDEALVEFFPTVTGYYYINVDDHGDETGTYKLHISAHTGHDDDRNHDIYSASTETTGRISVGSSVTGTMGIGRDVDWFKVHLTEGYTYIINLEGDDTGAGTLEDPDFKGVYYSNGDFISGTSNDDGGEGHNARIYFTPEVSGDYYLAAGSYGDETWLFPRNKWQIWKKEFWTGEGVRNPDAVGTYELSIRWDGDDYADNIETTGKITPGSSVKSKILNSDDVDWFRVSLTAGKTYIIDLKGAATGDGSLGDPYLHGIYDSSGNMIDGTADASSGFGLNDRVTFTPETTGTYYIAADSDGGDTWQKRGTYTLSITDDDYSDNRETAGHVTPGSSVEGKITADGDIDWIKVSLTAGQRYIIGLSGKDSGDGTLEDPYLRGIYDSSGNLIDGTSDDNSGWYRDADVEFVPETTGEYYIAVGSHGDSGVLWSFTGTYALSVDAEIDDDYSDNRETTGNITPGASVKGEIGSGSDIDWFRVELTKGKTYVIELKGRDTVDGTLGNPYLRGIYDSGGNYIDDTSNIYSTKEDDNYNRHWSYNARVVFTPETTGTYYIAADSDGGDTWQKRGTYTLSITDDDYSDNRETSGDISAFSSVLSAGTSVTTTGEITSGSDIDWFKVSLRTGKHYLITLKGKDSGDGTLDDPYLGGLYDSSGNLIDGTADDNSGVGDNAYVKFAPETAGTYYIAVGSHGDFDYPDSFTGTYDLSVYLFP